MAKLNPKHRRAARECILQSLYAWHVSGNAPAQVWQETLERVVADKLTLDQTYADKLWTGLIAECDALDAVFTPFLSIELSKLDPVELAILRLGTFELIHCLETPYKVIINEGLELAKSYGATDGFKFVNGVLDKVAQQVRNNPK